VSRSDKEIWSNLSEQADQFELPVEDFVWDAIESEVFPQKKKRGFFFWFKIGTGVLFIGLLTAASLLLFSYPNSGLNQQKRFLEDKNKMARHPQSFAQETIKKDTNESVRADADFNTTSLTTQAYSAQQTGSHFAAINTNKSNENKPITSTKAVRKTEEPASNNQMMTLNDQTEASIATSTEQGNIATTQANEADKNADTIHAISLLPSAEMAETKDTDTTQNLSMDSLNIINKSSDDPSKASSRFSILLHGGVGESFRILTSSSHHDLIVHKNDHETFGGCFAMGADLQFKLNDRFILRTGLGYKFYSDKYDFQHDLISHRTRNDYQYVQVPLIFGYSLWSNDRSDLYLLGGGNANFLRSAQSSWIDPGLLIPVAHSSQSTNTPFRSFTTAITLGLDYNFQISNRLKLHFIPSVDSFLNSIYKRETDLNELPYSFNLDIGISYNF